MIWALKGGENAERQKTPPQERSNMEAGMAGRIHEIGRSILDVRIKISFRVVARFWDGQILRVDETVDGQIVCNP